MENPENKSIIIYDLEIIRAIPVDDEEPVPGIEYCAGWKDYENCGISVLGAYDYHENRYRVFMEDNFSKFQELVNESDLIVGYNSKSFDDKICAANGIEIETGYDLLREIYRAKNLDPYPEEFGDEYRGYGLDAVMKANGPGGKSGHGEYAPILWQQKKYAQVIDYCLNDCRLEKLLFDRLLTGKPIIDPVTDEKLFLRCDAPWYLDHIAEDIHGWALKH